MGETALFFVFLMTMPLALIFGGPIIGCVTIVAAKKAEAREIEAQARLQEAENEAHRLGARHLSESPDHV